MTDDQPTEGRFPVTYNPEPRPPGTLVRELAFVLIGGPFMVAATMLCFFAELVWMGLSSGFKNIHTSEKEKTKKSYFDEL